MAKKPIIYLTTEEVAKLTNFSRRGVDKARERGELEVASKTGTQYGYTLEDVEAWNKLRAKTGTTDKRYKPTPPAAN